MGNLHVELFCTQRVHLKLKIILLRQAMNWEIQKCLTCLKSFD